jgi:Cytochrome P460
MKNSLRTLVLRVSTFVCVLWGATVASQNPQDRYKITAPDGVSFSEFRGYQDWKNVAVSTTKTGIKAILANDKMIKAYRARVPGNGQPFPDGSKVVKIEWMKKQNPVSPYFVEVPDTLKSLAFIKKDSKRFPETHGWGYAQFLYDPATKTFKPYGEDASFGKNVCFKCHTTVASTDYIFTRYPDR